LEICQIRYRMGYFFLTASLILLIMQVIIGLWFYFIFPPIGWKIPAVVLPVLLTAFVPLTMAYTRTHYGTLESVVYYVAYIWCGLVFIFCFFVLVFALLQGITSLFHLHTQPLFKWLSLSTFFVVTVLSLWGGFSSPKIKHISVSIPNAPKLTVAIISDTHLGEGVSLARWKKALAQIQAQQPDIILVLGDIFEYGMYPQSYADALKNLKTPSGTYGVFGNHEYYMGYQNSLNFYKQAGISLLQNELIKLPNGLQIIGVNDIKTTSLTADKLDALLEKSDAASTRILLSHQPLLTDTVAQHKIPLMLSGHTHAGQIFPFNLLVKLVYPYDYGLYQVSTHSQLYVTSGMFYWGMPLRLFAPAEIPILHIN